MMTDTGSKSKGSPDVMENGNVQDEADDLPDLVVEKLPKDVSEAKKRGRPKKGSVGKSKGRPKKEYDDLPDLESDGDNDMVIDNSVNDEENVGKHAVAKQRGRPKKKVATSDVDKSDESDEETRPVKQRGRPKKSYMIPEGSSDDEITTVQEKEPLTSKSRGRPKKTAASDDIVEPTETAVKQRGRPKKIATEATKSDEKDFSNEDRQKNVVKDKGSPKKESKSEKDFEEDPPVSKHRGRPNKMEEKEDLAADERSRKHARSRGRPKKVLEPEEDADEFDSDQDEPPAKIGRGRPKKLVVPEEDVDEFDSDQDEPPAKIGRGRPKKLVVREEDVDEFDSDQDEPPAKIGRGRPKKLVVPEDSYKTHSTGARQRGRPKKVSEDYDVEEQNEIDDDDYAPKERGRPKKSHAMMKHKAASMPKRGRPKGKANKWADSSSESDDEDDSNVRKSVRKISRDGRPSRAATMKVQYGDDDSEDDDGDSGEDWTADSRGGNVLDVKKKWNTPFTTKHRKPFSSVSSEEEEEYEYVPRLSKKRAASMDASESSSPAQSPKKEKVEKTHRTRCSLGSECTMRGPKHFHKCCHPGDDSYGEESHSEGEASGSGHESDSIDKTTPDPKRKGIVAGFLSVTSVSDMSQGITYNNPDEPPRSFTAVD